MKVKKRNAIYVGVDTGVHTGVALYDSHERVLLSVQTLALWRALDQVREWRDTYAPTHDFVVVIEDARQRKWIPREASLSERMGRRQGAGSVKRDASIWEEFLTDNKIEFRAIPPRKGATKRTPEYFAMLTGWKKRTSNHARDAAFLVFGL